MATSRSKATTASSTPSWTAGASVFSGRPDPSWPVSAATAADLVRIWESLPPEAAPGGPPPPGLGYRGCFLRSPDGRVWTAFGESVQLESGTAREGRLDAGARFESAVLRTAPEGLLPAWAPRPRRGC